MRRAHFSATFFLHKCTVDWFGQIGSTNANLMEKQRIKTFGREVFDQLRTLAW